jgi:hypothetical protein
MTKVRARREHQRGNTLLLAMIVLSALATLGSLTIVSVQGSFKASTHDRSQTIAMLAAESGAAVAMDYLRTRHQLATHWGSFVNRNNDPPFVLSNAPGEMTSNGALPPLPSPPPPPPPPPSDNLFDADQNAYYSVVVLNNRADPGFAAVPPNGDTDGQIIIQSTGHGPQGSLAIVEVEVRFQGVPTGNPGPPLQTFPAPPLTTPPTREAGMMLVSWRVVL